MSYPLRKLIFDVEGSIILIVANFCVKAFIRSLFLFPNFKGLLYYDILNKGFSVSLSFNLGIFCSIPFN